MIRNKILRKVSKSDVTLSDETVTQVTPGIIATDDGYQCLQCGNTDKRYMYEYETPFQKNV